MRRLVALALCALSVASNALTPYELSILQTNPAGTGFFQRYMAPLAPAPNTSGVLVYDGATTLPQIGVIGSGLAWNGTTLSATASAQVNSDWSAVSGVTEVLNKPVFNFGFPSTRTLTVSTDYQANDPSKPAILTVSPQCTNTTTVLAASACTMQVRMHTAAVTCGTGTVHSTWTSTYALGLLLTNASGSPITIHLPIGAHFMLCPTAGTFSVTGTVEQTAGL
jgi:hypothetical protein